MKIILNKLENFLKYRKEYVERCKNYCKNWEHREIYLKLYNEKSIKKCEKIIKDNFPEGTKDNLESKSFFCSPYLISIWNNNKKSKNIIYREEISDEIEKISIDKLYTVLKNNKKTYLELYVSQFSYWPIEKIVKLEI